MKKHCWFRNSRGATAIEYALIVAGLAVVIATMVFTTGGSLSGIFTSIESAVAGTVPSG